MLPEVSLLYSTAKGILSDTLLRHSRAHPSYNPTQSGAITTPPASNATETFSSLGPLPSTSDINSLPPDESIYFNFKPAPPRLPAWLETFVDPPTEFVDQGPAPSQEAAFTPQTGVLHNPPSIQWDSDLDAQVPNWLAGDDFDLNALNSSVLASAINDFPFLVCNDDDMSLLPPHEQSMNVDEYHEEYHIRQHWFSFISAGDTGHVTPELMPERTEVDDQYRENLSHCLQERVLSEPLPSTEFLVSLRHAPNLSYGILTKARTNVSKCSLLDLILFSLLFTLRPFDHPQNILYCFYLSARLEVSLLVPITLSLRAREFSRDYTKLFLRRSVFFL